MPNTLAHLGVQSLITRGLIRGADLKWAYLGLLIPDLPWIGLRVFKALPANPYFPANSYFYEALAYAHIQAPLLFSLLLAAVFAGFSSLPRRAFAILALNAALHLILDALQTKWANGVHFFAPVSWRMENFGLFWPESVVTVGLTLLGLCYIIATWRSAGRPMIDVAWPRGRRLWLIGVLLLAYGLAPAALLSGPKAADNHSIGTLSDKASRAGKPVAFDRAPVFLGDGRTLMEAPDGEVLSLEGTALPAAGKASLRGHFRDAETVVVEAYHQHWGVARDYPTLLALVLISVLWIKALWLRRRGNRCGKL